MRQWIAPLCRKLRAVCELTRIPTRTANRSPVARGQRLFLTQLEQRELMSIGTVIPQNNPGYESDTGFSQPGFTAPICIGLINMPTDGRTVTIDWTTVDGTARAGSDYTASSGTVSLAPIGPGPYDSAYFDYVFVPLINDTIPELTENFYIRLSNPTNGATLNQTDFPVTIKDDDTGTISPITYNLTPPPPCPTQDITTTPPTTNVDAPAGSGPDPVRYTDGVATIAADDLGGGLGTRWGVQRTWTNAPGYAVHPDAGNGWILSQNPYLIQQASGYDNTIIEVANGTTARFFDSVSSVYVSRRADSTLLAHDTTNHLFTLTDGTGATISYYDFSTTYAAGQRGRFAGLKDPAGDQVSVISSNTDGRPTEIQQSATVGGATVTESYLYAYSGTGSAAGLLASITLRRKVGAGSWGTVRSVEYGYYNGIEANGNLGDLKTAVVKDDSGNPIHTDYYRYYTSTGSGGFAGALKSVVSGPGYDLAAATLGSVTTATDAQLAPYAANAFQYDSNDRVTQEVVGGLGCPVCSSGQGTLTYAYTANTNTGGYNGWAMKTVETLPDGTVNTVYTNAYGEVMLKATQPTGSSSNWLDYYKYDSAGRVILHAAPSAITGYNDTYLDLVNFTAGNAQYLSDSNGLITTYLYPATTTAMTATAGDVAGYLKEADIKQGETGTAIPQESIAYFLHTAGGNSIFPVASDTVYRNDNGTGSQSTLFAYTYVSSTNSIASITATLPTVTTAQDGSGIANSLTTVYDTYGRPVWSKDQAGFITYTQYDTATGAVIKTINDVDTTQTSTFANLPSGWSTPSGGGLHLTSTYEVDSLGRVTKETTPEGRVNYTVYKDATHEVRYYSGWNTTTNTPTGPTTVMRDDWGNGYSETLTMSATPTVSGGRPTGAESISAVQSLSRTYTNSFGQTTYSDDYFNLAGLAYSTAANIGTEGTNFYRTRYGYDSFGRLNKVTSPQGTITRTVYDGLGRPVSDWVGTNDTPTTGYWSPTNLAGTNTVKVADYEYDGGSVGDSNLTKVTKHPGGGAADRVTQLWYDWRDRAVAVKVGVETSESTSVNRPLVYTNYNNLGEAIQTRLYDADGVTPTVTGGVPQPLSASLLRGQTTTSFDELGRAYRSDRYLVNPATGAVSTNSLHTDLWFDSRGNVIKTASPNGLVEKKVYDGAGRTTTDYLTDGGGDVGYTDAGNVTGDTVVQQTELTYDKDNNVIATAIRERFHNASGTGALGSPSTGIGARVSYTGNYYDNSERLTASVSVGTNGGSTWTRPGSVPSRSATALMTSYGYAADALQTVQLTGSPTGGTFTLTFGGQTTSAIAYNASAATVQTAVQALTTVGSGNAVVTAAPGGGWEVRFAGTLAATYQTKMTASGAGLTGGTGPSVAISTLSAGGDAGQAVDVTDPKALVNRTYSDAMGRATQSVGDFTDGAITDATNKTTNYGYNSAGMTSLTAALSNGGVQTTGYVYGVTLAGGSGIDSNDVVSATQYPDPTTGAPSSSQQETMKVNAVGQVLTSTDRNGNVHSLSYDTLGRVVSDAVTTLGTSVDGSVRRVETAYDPLGNVLKVTSYNAASAGTIVNQVFRDFNGLGQMITEWQSHSGAVVTSTSPKTQYAYNFNGSGTVNQSRQTSMTYPSGYALTYNYSSGLNSAISRLSSLSDSTGSLESYDFLGLSTVVRRAHSQPGVDLTYIKQGAESNGPAGDQYTGLDAFGRVVDQRWIKTSSGTATDRFQYGYDQNSNALYRDNLVNSAFGELYTYDNLNQVSSFQRGTLNGTKTGLTGSASRTQSWAFDALGNWNSVTTNGTAQTRTANKQNEITSVSGATTPTYDSNGNMTGDETGRKFVYDAWNRLVTVKNSGGTTLESFGYDGLNRRVTQTASGVTTDLFYSAQGQVLEEKVGSNTNARYVWSPVYVNAMILRDRSTLSNGTLDERLWVQQDANWNVTDLVNGTGVVVERYAYDAFGVQTIYDASYTVRAGSSYASVYGFQGMRYDSVSGLNTADARWYSPTLGRWVSNDPIGFAGGNKNLYGFVGNNPGNGVDPSGLADPPPPPSRTSRVIGAVGSAYDAVNLPGAVWNWWWSPSESEMQKPISTPPADITDARTRDKLPLAGTGGRESVSMGRQAVAGTTYKMGGTVVVMGGILAADRLTGGMCKYAQESAAAKLAYPLLAGKIQQHHITPKYLGGAANGPTVALDAAYHQLITNEFRRLHPYGSATPTATRLKEIMDLVYSKYPLPKP